MARLTRTGVLFAAIGFGGLAVPFVQFKPNRIVPGTGLHLPEALPPLVGLSLTAMLAFLLVGGFCGECRRCGAPPAPGPR